jgi:phage baseplate assembly protein gpV
MALESTTKIKGLNASSPTATDPVSQGDDHLRMIKDVLKKSFPSDVDVHVPEISGSTSHYLHTDGTDIDWNDTFDSVTVQNSDLNNVVLNGYREKVNVIASQSGNVTIDATAAQIQVLSVTGDMTITMAADTGLSITLAITKSDGVITWPSNIKWSGGVPPVLDNAEHVLTFFAVNNASWFGFVSGANMS